MTEFVGGNIQCVEGVFKLAELWKVALRSPLKR